MMMKMIQTMSGTTHAHDTICLQGIQCEGIIGVYAKERDTTRLMVVDVQFPTAASYAAAHDKLADTVDYAGVVERIREVVAHRSDALIETLAHHLVQDLLAHFQLNWIQLTLHKPDIIDAVNGVSITLYRQKAHV